MDRYLAIDIGSTSGRHIVGWMENGAIRQEEVYRFPNGPDHADGHFTWDIERLYREALEGTRRAFARFPDIRSLSVDTWGTDYVLMRGEQEILPCYTYRDDRTDVAVEAVHAIVPYTDLYRRCGYQFGRYNSIYQLYRDKMDGRMEGATDFLMMPEYLLYRLSGVKKKEATNNSTTSLVDPRTNAFDLELTRMLGLPDRLFPPLVPPGTVLGPLRPEVEKAVGGSCQVVMCATHDTESAISVIPMEQDQIYISSGTWSLLGVRIKEPITTPEGARAGFSNEGGMGDICYLTNIPGMFVPEQLRRELCPGRDFAQIIREAEESGYSHTIDPADVRFNAPESMREAFREDLGERGHPLPESAGDYFSCAYHSLAACYGRAIAALEAVTGQTYHAVYITGGGARNRLVNRLTEEYTGKKVIACPMEASTAGSIAVQMRAAHPELPPVVPVVR